MLGKDYIGRVVCSKSGRDEGRAFIISGIINDDYVYISDGDLRSIEKPKKKKIKHLNITDITIEELNKSILQGDSVSNKTVKQYIQSVNSNKEV